MTRSPKQNVEQLKILSFQKPPADDPEAVNIGEMILGLPLNTSQFALAAMLKGFHEFYIKPMGENSGLEIPPEMVKGYEHNLALWDKTNPPKSKIIL